MKRRLRHISIITLLAFFANVMLPFFATYTWPQAGSAVAAESSVSSVFGEKILICSEGGFKWVSLADLQNGQEKPHPEYKCPLCYVAAHGIKHTGPAHAAVTIVPSVGLQKPCYSESSATQPLFVTLSKFSRAPPAAIIA